MKSSGYRRGVSAILAIMLTFGVMFWQSEGVYALVAGSGQVTDVVLDSSTGQYYDVATKYYVTRGDAISVIADGSSVGEYDYAKVFIHYENKVKKQEVYLYESEPIYGNNINHLIKLDNDILREYSLDEAYYSFCVIEILFCTYRDTGSTFNGFNSAGIYWAHLVMLENLENEDNSSEQESNNEPIIPPNTSNDIAVYLNGNPITFDQPPIISNGRTLVPIRAIAEALDIRVIWDETAKAIVLVSNDDKILLFIDDNTVEVNGDKQTIDVPPTITNGRTLVPIRFISEVIGCSISWDDATKTITMNSENVKPNISYTVETMLSDFGDEKFELVFKPNSDSENASQVDSVEKLRQYVEQMTVNRLSCYNEFMIDGLVTIEVINSQGKTMDKHTKEGVDNYATFLFSKSSPVFSIHHYNSDPSNKFAQQEWWEAIWTNFSVGISEIDSAFNNILSILNPDSGLDLNYQETNYKKYLASILETVSKNNLDDLESVTKGIKSSKTTLNYIKVPLQWYEIAINWQEINGLRLDEISKEDWKFLRTYNADKYIKFNYEDINKGIDTFSKALTTIDFATYSIQELLFLSQNHDAELQMLDVIHENAKNTNNPELARAIENLKFEYNGGFINAIQNIGQKSAGVGITSMIAAVSPTLVLGKGTIGLIAQVTGAKSHSDNMQALAFYNVLYNTFVSISENPSLLNSCTGRDIADYRNLILLQYTSMIKQYEILTKIESDQTLLEHNKNNLKQLEYELDLYFHLS